MKKTLAFIMLLYSINAQNLDVNALRMAQNQMGISSSNQNTREEINQSNSITILDNEINPNNYLVGPGDLFRMNIISSDDISIYSLAVSPTGDILIPSIGIVYINGLSLNNAIKALTDKIYNLNPTAQVHIQLAEIRTFKIKVIGQLQSPGYYNATPVTRISDLFKRVIGSEKMNDNEDKMQFSSSLSDEEKDDFENNTYPELSNRNILIIRGIDTIKVDLIMFGSSGDNRFNPYVNQGDIIYMPLKENSIEIYGGIKIPGEYEYVKNETLYQLITLAGNLIPSANPNEIEITRFINATEKNTIPITLSESKSFIINPQDHIMVRYKQNFKRQDIIYIAGEILYPGSYTIIDGETTVAEIIKRAGNYTNLADKSKLFINNRSISKNIDREKIRIKLIPEENRSNPERAYIKARSMTKKGSIESTSLSQTEYLKNSKLVHDDRIIIPKNFDYIEILGGVYKPGRYPYSINSSFNEYINLAGGITKNATNKKFLIKAGTGQRLSASKSINIEKGDILFIPDKIEYNFWEVFKDILSTLGSIAALIVVIQNSIGS